MSSFNPGSLFRKSTYFEVDPAVESDRDDTILVENGRTIIRVQTKLWDDPGNIVIKRRLIIDVDGIQEVELDDKDIIQDFPFEAVRSFFYADDGCFVVFTVTRNHQDTNFVYRTNNMNAKVKEIIDHYVTEKLKKMEIPLDAKNNIQPEIIQPKNPFEEGDEVSETRRKASSDLINL